MICLTNEILVIYKLLDLCLNVSKTKKSVVYSAFMCWLLRVETVQGVIKIAIRCDFTTEVSKVEVRLWQFRLPATMLSELATTTFSDGGLLDTVPKSEVLKDEV